MSEGIQVDPDEVDVTRLATEQRDRYRDTLTEVLGGFLSTGHGQRARRQPRRARPLGPAEHLRLTGVTRGNRTRTDIAARIREVAAQQPDAATDLRPREGERGWHDVTCGSCGAEFGTNFRLDEIECAECEARRCPGCRTWFGADL